MRLLIEPYAGSAALSLYYMGARRALVPYQGSKWRIRGSLHDLVYRLSGWDKPTHIQVSDPGPFGRVLDQIFLPHRRLKLIRLLEELNEEDPRAVYDRLNNRMVPQLSRSRYAAEFLFLQRLSFSGKSVREVKKHWKSPGFNQTSAYGLQGTDRFGAVKPMVPSLIRWLRQFHELVDPEIQASSSHCTAQALVSNLPSDAAIVAYLDPPYVGSTGYGQLAVPRSDVVQLAHTLWGMGATVIVSEAESLVGDLGQGWQAEQIGARGGDSPFRGKQSEWLTYRAAA